MGIVKTIRGNNYNIHSQKEWFKIYNKNFSINTKNIVNLGKENSEFQFEIREQVRYRLFNEKHLFPLGHGPNDFVLFPLLNEGYKEFANSCKDHLLSIIDKWDFLHLYYVPESSSGWFEFKSSMEEAGFQVSIRRHRHFYFVDTTADWDSYYNDFLHKSLRDVRGRFNRLKKANLSYKVVEQHENIKDHLEKLLTIYDQRRQSTGQQNAFSRNAHRKMLEEVVEVYEKKGWIQLSYLLGSDDKIWAYQLDFLKDGIQYHYTPAFDENYKFYSPSKILLFETLKSAFHNPKIIQFNFMRGESPYKTQYAREKEDYIFMDIENRNSKNLKRIKKFKKVVDLKNKLLSRHN
ncbi:GNAT family N-acetyltransferase [Hyphobacterium sp. CCMP332]|nr:GNAT family N-acetyltransferase [Hyphobacterium sp. CCMP332]